MAQVNVEKLLSKFYQFCQVRRSVIFTYFGILESPSSNRVVVISKVVSEWLEKGNGYKGATVFFKNEKKKSR